jgi:glucose-6-phosphate isomerase
VTSVVAAGGVSVTTRDIVEEAQTVLDRLVSDGVPRALAAGSSHLWGPDAAGVAARRLGWLDLPESSRALLPRLAELRAAALADGLDRVVLAAVGGAALAPEVITRCAGAELTVLDTTDPHQVGALLGDRLDRTVVVVSSEHGDSIETDSHRRIFEKAFKDAGITGDALRRRFVVVTHPGSPLEEIAHRSGYPVVLADPNVGGRYGALSAFGLVPSALAGVDVARLLDEAATLRESLHQPYDNPGLALGAALGASARSGQVRLAIAARFAGSGSGSGSGSDSGDSGFGDWVEQLIAESTGKDGRGILPIVVEGADAPGFEAAAGIRRVVLGPVGPAEAGRTGGTGAPTGTGGAAGAGGPAGRARSATAAARSATAGDAEVSVRGPLGAQFLLWQYATAVAGRVLGVNPFDQPNVRESAANTAALLRGVEEGAVPTIIAGEPALVEGAVEVHAPSGFLKGATDLESAFDALVMVLPDRGYLAIMAFLDRGTPGPGPGHRGNLGQQRRPGDAAAERLRPLLARRAAQLRRTAVPVTFGWGPRFLHSTGQYHKGGPQNGVFLQLTGAVTEEVAVPGKAYTLTSLQLAQAFGDLRALRSLGRPAVRVHLRDRAEGLEQLLTALKD